MLSAECFLVLASSPLVANQPMQQARDYGQQDGPDNCRSPTADPEFRIQEPRSHFQHGRIDDDQEGYHLQEQSESSIHQANDQGGNQCILEIWDANANLKFDDNPKCNCVDQPSNKQFHCGPPFVKTAFGNMTWTPLLPSTNSVMSTSPATLVSM